MKNKFFYFPFLVWLGNRGLLFLVLLTYFFFIYQVLPKHINFFEYFLFRWARADSSFYFSIAKQGYSYTPGQYSNVAFYPLYPLILKATNFFLKSFQLSGILLSNLFFLIALVYLYKLACLKISEKVARSTLFLIAFYPFSFYFSTAYAESLFLMLAVLSFYFAEKNHYFWASITGALSSASRFWGLFLFPALILHYLEKISFDTKKIKPDIFFIFLVPFGFFCYVGFLWQKFKINPYYLISSAHKVWGRSLFNFTRINYLFTHFLADARANLYLFYMVLIVIFGFSLIKIWKSLGISYTIFSAGIIFFPLLTSIQSTGRFLSVVFPAFIVFAEVIIKNNFWKVIIYLFCGFMLISLSLFFLSGGKLY